MGYLAVPYEIRTFIIKNNIRCYVLCKDHTQLIKFLEQFNSKTLPTGWGWDPIGNVEEPYLRDHICKKYHFIFEIGHAYVLTNKILDKWLTIFKKVNTYEHSKNKNSNGIRPKE